MHMTVTFKKYVIGYKISQYDIVIMIIITVILKLATFEKLMVDQVLLSITLYT